VTSRCVCLGPAQRSYGTVAAENRAVQPDARQDRVVAGSRDLSRPLPTAKPRDRCLGSKRCHERCRVNPNFALLDMGRPEVATLVAAMTRLREAVEPRSWSHPLEHAGDDWWADVLADPARGVTTQRALTRTADRSIGSRTRRARPSWSIEGGVRSRRVGRRARSGPSDAGPARTPSQTGVREAGFNLGSLRGALRRTDPRDSVSLGRGS
jgi:hypothetical protein